eukprot:30007-Chlamydomonas_euryale.AAC.1
MEGVGSIVCVCADVLILPAPLHPSAPTRPPVAPILHKAPHSPCSPSFQSYTPAACAHHTPVPARHPAASALLAAASALLAAASALLAADSALLAADSALLTADSALLTADSALLAADSATPPPPTPSLGAQGDLEAKQRAIRELDAAGAKVFGGDVAKERRIAELRSDVSKLELSIQVRASASRRVGSGAAGEEAQEQCPGSDFISTDYNCCSLTYRTQPKHWDAEVPRIVPSQAF